jgi:hypothetical protein
MQKQTHWLTLFTLVAICCFSLTSVGCKSMKKPFSKMAFWKKDGPPKSMLAERGDRVAPPSRSASVLEGTTGTSASGSTSANVSNERYAQNESSPAGGGRTQPYTLETPRSPNSSGLAGSAYQGSGTSIDGYASETNRYGNAEFNQNSLSGSNPSLAGNNGGPVKPPSDKPPTDFVEKYAPSKTAPARTTEQDNFGLPSSNANNQLANGGPVKYPSTNFNAFGPKASTAGFDANEVEQFNDVSQASSTQSLSNEFEQKQSFATPATNVNANYAAQATVQSNSGGTMPTPPSTVLNRQGSYAPGSIGATGSRVAENTSMNSSGPQRCPTGCSCSSCSKSSSGGDFGGFYNR